MLGGGALELDTLDTVAAVDVPVRLQLMADHLRQLCANEQKPPRWVGIQTGGVWVAQHLRQLLGHTDETHAPLGELNISFYRDDFSQKGLHPSVRPSRLPFSSEDQPIVLVDDVLMTGRTIRAALNELFDFGRPASVWLVVLVEMAGRELPIASNVAGVRLQLPSRYRVKLRGPGSLSLEATEYFVK